MLGFLASLSCGRRDVYLFQAGADRLLRRGAKNPKAAINITGVKTDLIRIATAERLYFASEGKYASLDELIANQPLPSPPTSSLYL